MNVSACTAAFADIKKNAPAQDNLDDPSDALQELAVAFHVGGLCDRRGVAHRPESFPHLRKRAMFSDAKESPAQFDRTRSLGRKDCDMASVLNVCLDDGLSAADNEGCHILPTRHTSTGDVIDQQKSLVYVAPENKLIDKLL